jgi:hypothetical protein
MGEDSLERLRMADGEADVAAFDPGAEQRSCCRVRNPDRIGLND